MLKKDQGESGTSDSDTIQTEGQRLYCVDSVCEDLNNTPHVTVCDIVIIFMTSIWLEIVILCVKPVLHSYMISMAKISTMIMKQEGNPGVRRRMVTHLLVS